MRELRSLPRSAVQFDFLVHSTEPYPYEPEALALGARVLRCPDPHRPWVYIPRLRRILRESGPFDVVHAHQHYFNAVPLYAACREGVPVRIAHSHLDTSSLDMKSSPLRALYVAACRLAISRYATTRLAASAAAGRSLFGDNSAQVLDYSIDLETFRAPVDPATLRKSLGIPPEAIVFGHAGRFDEQKNHSFLLEIARAIQSAHPRAWFLLIGDGPLRPAIEQASRGLNAVFTGSVPNLAQLMRGAMDAFIFPSRYEGLGLVLVEAQAAGLPCLISRSLPPEAEVVPHLLRRLSLDASPSEWAAQALDLPSRLASETALQALQLSRFNRPGRLALLYDQTNLGLTGIQAQAVL